MQELIFADFFLKVSRELIFANWASQRISLKLIFAILAWPRISGKLIFVYSRNNFLVFPKENIFHGLWIWRIISIKINNFYLNKFQNDQWSHEDLIQKALYQTETPIFAVHKFLKIFTQINFCESPILKNFAGIIFCQSTFSGVK